MIKTRYDYNFLLKFTNDNNIKLLEDYSNTNLKINRNTQIRSICLTTNCNEIVQKIFRSIVEKAGNYCKKCTLINSKNKIKNTNLNKFGSEHALQNETIKNKLKKTNIERYGVENPLQNKIIRNKIKKTNLDKYGVEYPTQSINIKNKVKTTNLERYGAENPMQNNNIKNKVRTTNLDKYKTSCTLHNDIIKEKVKKTNLEKYGVENPMQHAEIAEKNIKSGFRSKKFIMPSGKELICQGYEPFALSELIKTINEDDIINGCSNVPKITYLDKNNKIHFHYVDIYIPSLNKCIEVKSSWTVLKENIFLKQNAGKELGFNYEIWVYDNKGNKVQTFT